MNTLDRRSVLAGGAGLALAPLSAAQAGVLVGDMTLGRPHARVKVIEYASASCSHCARFHREVFPQFKKKYIDTGKVHLTLREVLTAPADVAAAGFLMARCRGPAAYFTTLQTIYGRHSDMFEPGGLIRVGEAAGLSRKQIETCVSDEAGLAASNASTDRATAAGVEATPTFFINGVKAHEGFWPFAEMAAALDAALVKKPR